MKWVLSRASSSSAVIAQSNPSLSRIPRHARGEEWRTERMSRKLERPLSRRKLKRMIRDRDYEAEERVEAAQLARREYTRKVGELRKIYKAEVDNANATREETRRQDIIAIQKRKHERKLERGKVMERNRAEHEDKMGAIRTAYKERWEQVKVKEEDELCKRSKLHASLLDSLKLENPFWLTSQDDIKNKVTDDLWLRPGDTASNVGKRKSATSVGAYNSGLPGSHYWRSFANTGLGNTIWAEEQLEYEDRASKDFNELSEKYLHQKMRKRQELAMAARHRSIDIRGIPNDTRFNDAGLELFVKDLEDSKQLDSTNTYSNFKSTLGHRPASGRGTSKFSDDFDGSSQDEQGNE